MEMKHFFLPILDFYLRIPFICIQTSLWKEWQEACCFEYIKVKVDIWKYTFNFRLYNTHTIKPVKVKLKKHPKKCPYCKAKGAVTYERFSLTHGEYLCDECGWSMDALTGKVIAEGFNE